jgi:hypothetical protein
LITHVTVKRAGRIWLKLEPVDGDDAPEAGVIDYLEQFPLDRPIDMKVETVTSIIPTIGDAAAQHFTIFAPSPFSYPPTFFVR